MQVTDYISSNERKALLVVGFAMFIFATVGFIIYNITEHLERVEFYRQQDENRAQGKPSFSGPYCFPNKHPQKLLKIAAATGLTFFLLIFSKRFILSTVSTFIVLELFIAWYFSTQNEILYDESGNLQGIDRIFLEAGNFDLLVFSLSIILLFWQFSILLRVLIKSAQRKNVLP